MTWLRTCWRGKADCVLDSRYEARKAAGIRGLRKDGRRIPHIGLPGNPVSSMVAFDLFGRPAMFKMMGKTDFRRPIVRAIAEDRITNIDDPRVFLARCMITERDGRYYARLTGSRGIGDSYIDDESQRSDRDPRGC